MVYVDDMFQFPVGQYGRMKMSHMIADTDEELHAMAKQIGVARKWWQAPPHDSHYDIALSKRTLAIKLGAIPITMKQAAMMCRRRKITGQLGTPGQAAAWYDEYLKEKFIIVH